MNAVVSNGPRDVRVIDVPEPQLGHPSDGVVRVTRTYSCGSDLHLYEGRTALEMGRIIGHEPLGEVVEVGRATVRVKVGDLVCVRFNVACGFCRTCEKGYTGACVTINPGHAGGADGFADMGPFQGGPAQHVRVPFGDFNGLRLPEDARDKEGDHVMLADILPTGWHATRLAGLMPGDSVGISGAGLVGLMAARAAMIPGARQMMVVDRHQDRVKLAEKAGATGINDAEVDPVDRVIELTRGVGADRGCECVGWQCHDPAGKGVPNDPMNKLVAPMRATGKIGVVGVFVPRDPTSPDRLMKRGQIAFDIGQHFTKGLQIGSGLATVQADNRDRRDLIHEGCAGVDRVAPPEAGAGPPRRRARRPPRHRLDDRRSPPGVTPPAPLEAT